MKEKTNSEKSEKEIPLSSFSFGGNSENFSRIKKKVLLINPYWFIPDGYEERAYPTIPCGIVYIASYLEKKGITVKILDTLLGGFETRTSSNGIVRIGMRYEDIERFINEFKPDIVGISCMFTSQSNALYDLSALIKKSFPKMPIVAGGHHVTSCLNEVMKDKNIDIAVKGEGEIAMYEILTKKLSEVKNICYRSGDNVIFTGDDPSHKLLDDFEISYNLIDIDKYHKANLRSGDVSQLQYEKKWMWVFTSRGCPFGCFFCSVQNVFGKLYRMRNSEKVLDEIEMLVKRYGINHILIGDDNFTLDIERAKSILKGIIKRRLNVTWEATAGLRADRIDEELVGLMKKTGCKKVVIGVESGDDDYRARVIKKNLDIKNVFYAVDVLTKNGIDANAFFILGMPGETKNTMENTVNLAIKLARRGVFSHFSMASPMPSTEMTDIAIKEKLLVKQIEPIDLITIDEKPLIKVEGYTQEQLVKFRRKAIFLCLLNSFLYNPIRFFSKRSTKSIIKRKLKI